MNRRWICRAPLLALLTLLLVRTPGNAGLFNNNGIGSAMYYGPYTGGHIYSYNTAYGYYLPFNFADSWRYDPLAYPGGPYPYHPTYPLLARVHDRRNPGVIADDPAPAALNLLPVPEAGCATVRVTVPATAEVWFEGQQTKQTGPNRTFQSPVLEPGKNYIYTIRARWSEAGGAPVEQFQAVTVRAGANAAVEFSSHRP
jgi:uncharacterized protein (TIGR03000 family)